MVLRAVTVTLAAATASAELQCIGRVAHEVLAAPEVGNYSVWPTPERNAECLASGENGGQQKHFCTGVNENQDCTGADREDIDLGHYYLHCKDCFVAAETDIFYKLETSYFIPQHFSFGLENIKLLAKVSIGLDGPVDIGDKHGVRHLFPDAIVGSIGILPFTTAVSVEMPTDIFYDLTASVGVTGDIGASFSVEIDEFHVRWDKGRGWHKTLSKPVVSFKHSLLPEEISLNAAISTGFTSNFKVKFGQDSWYTAKISGKVPVTCVGKLNLTDHHAQGCLDMGIDVDVLQEAEVNLKLPLYGSIEEHHFGPFPWGLHEPSLVHKCFGLVDPLPSALVV